MPGRVCQTGQIRGIWVWECKLHGSVYCTCRGVDGSRVCVGKIMFFFFFLNLKNIWKNGKMEKWKNPVRYNLSLVMPWCEFDSAERRDLKFSSGSLCCASTVLCSILSTRGKSFGAGVTGDYHVTCDYGCSTGGLGVFTGGKGPIMDL